MKDGAETKAAVKETERECWEGWKRIEWGQEGERQKRKDERWKSRGGTRRLRLMRRREGGGERKKKKEKLSCFLSAAPE